MLVRNMDKSCFGDQCRHAFDLKQEAHLRRTRDRSRVNWEEFACCQVRANETHARRPCVSLVTERGCSYECPVPHKWWSTLKSAVFGSRSSLPPLVSEGGGLVCE